MEIKGYNLDELKKTTKITFEKGGRSVSFEGPGGFIRRIGDSEDKIFFSGSGSARHVVVELMTTITGRRFKQYEMSHPKGTAKV